jgi:hypothetical protein
MRFRCLAGAAALFAVGCARVTPPGVPTPRAAEYLDLQAGWRLRVTTLLGSNGYKIQAQPEADAANTLTLKAEGDVAYETAYYSVLPLSRHRIRIALTGAQVTRNGNPAPDSGLQGWRIPLSAPAPHIRIVFLRRSSERDHDMVLLTARDTARLDALTRAVQKGDETEACIWIPGGVALLAERPAGTAWEPVL